MLGERRGVLGRRTAAWGGGLAGTAVAASTWPVLVAVGVVGVTAGAAALGGAAVGVASAPATAARAAGWLLQAACAVAARLVGSGARVWVGAGEWVAAGGEWLAQAAVASAAEALLAGSEEGAKRRLVLGLLLCYAVGGECASAPGAGGLAVAGGAVRVMFWNARAMGAAVAGAKREWLAEQVETARPVVVVLCEVSGDFSAMKRLRRWAACRLKYDMRFLVGEGGNATNGIVALVDRAQGSFGASKRLAERTLGFEVTHKADAQTRAYVGLHGLAGAAFTEQLREAREWMRERGGGLALGDFNHVPCRLWRTSGAKLSPQDRQMQRFCGAVCETGCCGGFTRAVGGRGAAGRVVGGAGCEAEAEGAEAEVWVGRALRRRAGSSARPRQGTTWRWRTAGRRAHGGWRSRWRRRARRRPSRTTCSL